MKIAKNEMTKSRRLIARFHDERAETVTHHTANNVAIYSKPFKTQGHCLRERQRGGQSRSLWQGTMNTQKWSPKEPLVTREGSRVACGQT